MRVDLTPRSAEIIAREQAGNGAISPEQLIEQAPQAYSGPVPEPSWFHASPAEREVSIIAILHGARESGHDPH